MSSQQVVIRLAIDMTDVPQASQYVELLERLRHKAAFDSIDIAIDGPDAGTVGDDAPPVSANAELTWLYRHIDDGIVRILNEPDGATVGILEGLRQDVADCQRKLRSPDVPDDADKHRAARLLGRLNGLTGIFRDAIRAGRKALSGGEEFERLGAKLDNCELQYRDLMLPGSELADSTDAQLDDPAQAEVPPLTPLLNVITDLLRAINGVVKNRRGGDLCGSLDAANSAARQARLDANNAVGRQHFRIREPDDASSES